MPNRFKLSILTIFIIALAALFFVYNNFYNKGDGNKISDPARPSSGTGNDNEFVKGYVLVTFKEGTTYKQAVDLIKGYGFELMDANAYWKATNFEPSETTILKNNDTFKVYVGVGREDEMVKALNNDPPVRAAEKDLVGKIN
jgi:hypothetical protein